MLWFPSRTLLHRSWTASPLLQVSHLFFRYKSCFRPPSLWLIFLLFCCISGVSYFFWDDACLIFRTDSNELYCVVKRMYILKELKRLPDVKNMDLWICCKCAAPMFRVFWSTAPLCLLAQVKKTSRSWRRSRTSSVYVQLYTLTIVITTTVVISACEIREQLINFSSSGRLV